MPPATTSCVIAKLEATSRSRASREIRLATISTTWQKRPACRDSRSGLRGTLPSEFFANDLRSLHHRAQLCESHFLREVQQTAVGQHNNSLGRNELQSFAQPLCNDVRSFDFVRFYIHDADANF